jgi:Flp pilus assembly protein TadB
MQMQKPPITISCDCGESREVAYGEAWTCDSCGRVWDTNQIPADEYEGLLRRMRRVRLEAFVLAGVLAAVLVPLIVFVNATLIFAIPALAAVWLFLYLPFWRRRARRTAASSPAWELHPE